MLSLTKSFPVKLKFKKKKLAEICLYVLTIIFLNARMFLFSYKDKISLYICDSTTY